MDAYRVDLVETVDEIVVFDLRLFYIFLGMDHEHEFFFDDYNNSFELLEEVEDYIELIFFSFHAWLGRGAYANYRSLLPRIAKSKETCRQIFLKDNIAKIEEPLFAPIK